MLTASSKLFPTMITAQCNEVIGKLQRNNEVLGEIKKAMTAFMCDETNHTQGISNLKLKMIDYTKTVNLLSNANDEDIADCRKLIALVAGVPDIYGELVLRQIYDRTRDKDFYRRRIDYFAQARREIPWYSRWNPFNRDYTNARNSQNDYQRLYDDNENILEKYKEREETFNRIEKASKNFFTIGCGMREAAKSGVGYIRDASPGLPYSFESPSLYQWRSDARLKESDAANRLVNRLVSFDANGYMIVSEEQWAIVEALLRLPYDETTEIQYMAIARLFEGIYPSDNQLGRFVRLLATQIDVVDRREDSSVLRFSDPAVFTTWRYCTEKITNIQRHLTYAMDFARTENDRTRLRQLNQRAAILSVMLDLNEFEAGGMIAEGHSRTMFAPLTATEEAYGPAIRFSRDADGGFDVTFTIETRTVGAITHYDPLSEVTWNISNSLAPHGANSRVLQIKAVDYEMRYSFSGAEHFGRGVFNVLLGFVDPTGLSGVSDIALGYIAAIENRQAAERRLQDARLSNMLETFAFIPIVVTDGNTGAIQSFHYTASPHTYILLDAMNAEFYKQNIPTVTMETLLEHMPVIYALYHDRLDSDTQDNIQKTIPPIIQNEGE